MKWWIMGRIGEEGEGGRRGEGGERVRKVQATGDWPG